MTGETTNEARAACRCGKYALSTHAPWVALPDTVHTPDRCGAFLRLDVTAEGFNESTATLAVTWPTSTHEEATP